MNDDQATVQPSQENVEKCPLCAKDAPAGYIICPNCNHLRPDIYRDKIIYYATSVIFGLALGLFVVLILSGVWHDRTIELKEVEVFQGMYPLRLPEFKNVFSFSKMLSSVSGLGLIVSLVSSGILCTVYYIRASRKLGSWIWL